ncbi:MAG: 2,3-diphosphoglycerate synthetase [Candidatus Heimdallarchaeota archaeon]
MVYILKIADSRVDIKPYTFFPPLPMNYVPVCSIGLSGESLVNDGVILLVDGEHYMPVVKDAIHTLAQSRPVVAAVFVGGMEKIGALEDLETYFGIPMIFPENLDALESMWPSILSQYPAKIVFDLSDDPVIDSKARMKLANSILYHGLTYEGADFILKPIKFPTLIQKPSLSVIGSGKRVGKTAIAGYIARTLKAAEITAGILTMGRGGPAEPELVEGDAIEITPEFLLRIAEQGKHAASDFWEDALTSRVWTIGCRRCAGGMAGMPFTENVKRGAQLANELPVDLIILEGSGPTIPPVAANAFILVVGANRPTYLVLDYLGPYRVKLAQLVIITNCEAPLTNPAEITRLTKGIREINPNVKVVETIFRPFPLENIKGQCVFYCTTAPSHVVTANISSYIEETYQCEVVGFSSNLSNRPLLKADLNAAKGRYTILLTELKAAAVDIATKEALYDGKRVVYCDNLPLPLKISPEIFSNILVRLAKGVIALKSSDGKENE